MGRSPCCEKNGLKKGPWTPEEDQKLIDYIQKHGHGSWRTLPKNAADVKQRGKPEEAGFWFKLRWDPSHGAVTTVHIQAGRLARCGKSCRLRWTNYLRPDIKRGRFSFDEEETIIQLHSILGNKWSVIAARLPGRTDNEIKNYWNTHIRKRLLRMGIDPVTHSPRLDLLDLSSLLTNQTLYNQAQFDVSSLLGIDQLAVNPELLRIATNLLSPQCQDSILFQLQNQVQDQVPSCTTSTPQFFINEQSHVMQPNVAQLQPNHADQSNMWHANGKQCNFLENLGYENMEQLSVPQFVTDNSSNFYLPNNQNYNMNTTSPVSSPAMTQLNSSSTTYVNSSTEDERDSYCSELFDFQIPELLDVSEFL